MSIAEKRKKFMKKAKKKTAEELSRRDRYLGQLSRCIDEIKEVQHILTERLEELYTSYLPGIKITNEKDVDFVISFDGKNVEELEDLLGKKKTEEIRKKLSEFKTSLTEEDVKIIKELGKKIKALYELERTYEKHLEKIAEELCPNMNYFAGPHLSAKLISHVGSLEKLAKLPASTIQVLGAEKALFRHLRSKGRAKPPKHGIIFQHPKIRSVPKKLRGKIARTFAAKLAIAIKADAYGKHFVAKELKEEFEKRWKEVVEK